MFTRLNKFKNKKYLLLVPFLLVIIFSIPHLFQKPLAIDEGIYVAVINGVFKGKLLYKEVWDHKPPLLFLFFSPVSIWGLTTGMLIIRLIVILLNLFNIFIFYKILKRIKIEYKYILIILCGLAFFLSTQIFLGNNVNAEQFFLPLIFIVIYRMLKEKVSYLEGFLMALSFLIKFQAFAEIAFTLFLFFLIYFKNKKIFPFKTLLKVLVGFLIPIIVFVILFTASGTLSEAIFATLTVNFGYVDQYKIPIDLGLFTIDRKYIILVTFVILFLGLYIKYFLKNKAWPILTNRKFLILNIFLAESFLVLYPERNSIHYLLQLMPSYVFISAYFLSKWRYVHSILRRFLIVLIAILSCSIFSFVFTGSNFLLLNPFTNSHVIRYYYEFLKDGFTGTEGYPYFYTYNQNQKLSNYIHDNYAKYSSRYLYTTDAETFTLSNVSYTNKYFLYTHMYFTDQMYEEEKGRMLSSEVIILLKSIPIRASLMEEIEAKYKYVENYSWYAFYVRK